MRENKQIAWIVEHSDLACVLAGLGCVAILGGLALYLAQDPTWESIPAPPGYTVCWRLEQSPRSVVCKEDQP